ncbi:MAG: hypothetical protein ABIR58_06420 [Gemmatimonadaceae bacterium]
MSALDHRAMRACVNGAVLATLAVGMPGAAHGQSQRSESLAHDHVSAAVKGTDASVTRLLDGTRKAAGEFHDRRAAIASGYRRIGPDVPSMGEHWISPRLVVADSFDVNRPALLTYIMVAGQPALTGVVYAVPLTAGQSPPTIFGSDAMWHEHNGTLDEEALLPDHHTAPSAAKGTRLSILHAWLWSPNPQGMFATDNWTIPFLRLRLLAPATSKENAGRALSLLSGAEEYYVNLAGAAAAAVVRPLLNQCEMTAAKIVERARKENRALTDGDTDDLGRAWTDAMIAVASVADPEVARRINGGRMP